MNKELRALIEAEYWKNFEEHVHVGDRWECRAADSGHAEGFVNAHRASLDRILVALDQQEQRGNMVDLRNSYITTVYHDPRLRASDSSANEDHPHGHVGSEKPLSPAEEPQQDRDALVDEMLDAYQGGSAWRNWCSDETFRRMMRKALAVAEAKALTQEEIRQCTYSLSLLNLMHYIHANQSAIERNPNDWEADKEALEQVIAREQAHLDSLKVGTVPEGK